MGGGDGTRAGLAQEAGLRTRFDAVGNLWGRAEGTDGGRSVVTGSHVDTVRQGGKYDGALGVHMAIAAVQRFWRQSDSQITPRSARHLRGRGQPLRLLLLGCPRHCRAHPPDEPNASPIRREDHRRRHAARGLDPARIPDAERHDIAAFVEAHIEQGAILERDGYPLGVVSTITGQRWMQVTVTGIQNHAGTTPMDLRHDALAGAAAMIERITAAAVRMGRPAVATVGRIQAFPGGTNIIPGRCEFTVDTRHADPAARQQLLAEIEAIISQVDIRPPANRSD